MNLLAAMLSAPFEWAALRAMHAQINLHLVGDFLKRLGGGVYAKGEGRRLRDYEVPYAGVKLAEMSRGHGA